jgi:hypothetical protein
MPLMIRELSSLIRLRKLALVLVVASRTSQTSASHSIV